MLLRSVRMTFHPDRVDDFLRLFDTSADAIRAFPGCLHLELWQDERYPNVLSTFSKWEDDAALAAYRKSELFSATWEAARVCFASAPTAHSQTAIRQIDSSKQ